MKKTIVTCDVCKEEKKCNDIWLEINGGIGKHFDVCDDCCIKSNIFDKKQSFQYKSPPTTAEQLFNLLQEIAVSAVERR